MIIKKKVKCLHCNSVVEEEGKCACGKVSVAANMVTEGAEGIDYQDISAKLLNEVEK